MKNKLKHIFIMLLCFSILSCKGQEEKPLTSERAQELSWNKYKRVTKLMGSRFDITVVAEDQKKADEYIDLAIAEITRIENLISSWSSHSQTSEIIRNAGIKPVKADKELYDLIERSLKVSVLTQGVFDISYASMDKIWKFDGSMDKMPSEEEIKESVARVGYKKIILDSEKQTVFLTEKGMKIGFGGIGKGYAADKAKEYLKELGVKAGIINASGDLSTWGKQPDGTAWKVGIKNPIDNDKIISWLAIDNSSIVTSGNYEKFVEFDGKKYTHIINPRTGYPAFGIKSVSVICSSAELSDALATTVFILGVEKGLQLIDELKGVEAIIVDDALKFHFSKGINLKQNLLSE